MAKIIYRTSLSSLKKLFAHFLMYEDGVYFLCEDGSYLILL